MLDNNWAIQSSKIGVVIRRFLNQFTKTSYLFPNKHNFAASSEKKVLMKRINEYKKLYKVEKAIDLKEIKSTYRNFVKEWHPDKFQDPQKKLEAEEVTIKIIDGYHFLVSIAPETKEKNLAAYTETITKSRVIDYKHKSLLLEVNFADGNTYEYFGVNRKKFIKFINAKSMNNFGRRHIFNSFLYRKAKRQVETV